MILKTAELGEELEKILGFETLIADLSSKFLNLPASEVDREIMNAERRICELLGLDLVVLWQLLGKAPDAFTATHYYVFQQGPQPPGQLKQEDYPWATRQLLAGRIVAVSSLNEMPAEAARDRDVCRRLGIKSSLALPLSVGGGSPVGILALNTTRAERDWPDVLVTRLQVIAQIFANALARKRAEQALQESEAVSRATFEQAAVGIAHVGIDGRWLRVNDKLCAIVGYSREELLQLTFQDITHIDDLGKDLGHMHQVLSGEIKTYSMEKRYLRKDGSTVWANLTVSLVHAAGGEPRHFIAVVEDITGRKRVEEALRASEARLQAGTDLAGLGYYEIDLDGGASFIDDRFHEICGVPPGQQQSLRPLQSWMEHLHPDDRQYVLDQRQRLHEGTIERISIEYRYRHPADGEKWIHHMACIAARNAAGRATRAYGVVRDITSNKRAEMDARQLRDNMEHLTRVNTLGVLSGSLAHELNQPLGIILSNAQAAQDLLAQEPPDLAEVQSILSDIVVADRRAGEVIQWLRGWLKRSQIQLQPLPLNQVIEDFLFFMRADLVGRGITLSLELAADLPPVAGNRVQLQQLFANLILNAAEAMAANPPGHRRLHIQTTVRQGQVRSSVRDEGGGLAADVDRLFQPFYTTKPQGLGMGLAICRSIVAAHHGRLWAEPHAERGAVFHFELPVAGSQEKP